MNGYVRSPVHLHWSFRLDRDRAREVLAETTKAVALCGQKDLPRKAVTLVLDRATCRTCQDRADTVPEARPRVLDREPDNRAANRAKTSGKRADSGRTRLRNRD